MTLRAPGQPVQFYLPCDQVAFDRLPRTIDEYWQWQISEPDVAPYWGRYHWVLQTYLQLHKLGRHVMLVREVPRSGIVVSHMDCFDYGLRPSRERFLVVLLVDREVPHPYASLHITHNPIQTLPMRLAYQYMPPWPQVGLRSRSTSRGDRFETVAFVGYEHNLHANLASPSFTERLTEIGLRLVIPSPSEWHDFSNFDAVIAIRNLGRAENHRNKPALKLYNAWLAQVPAVMGYEEAYRAEGTPGVNYIEAVSPDEAFGALKRLRDDLAFRNSIVENGTLTAQQFAEPAAAMRWVRLCDDVLTPAYERWSASSMPALRCRVAGSVRERLLWRRPSWFGVANPADNAKG